MALSYEAGFAGSVAITYETGRAKKNKTSK